MAGGLGLTVIVGDCGPDNLLSNAVKFTEAAGTIELKCGASDKSVWIKVRDTGIGISQEHLEILDPGSAITPSE